MQNPLTCKTVAVSGQERGLKMDYESKKVWLMRFRLEKSKIAERTQEVHQLEDALQALTAMKQVDKHQQRRCTSLLRLTKRQLLREIMEAESIKAQVADAISTVPDPMARDILRRHYILGQKWEDVAQEIHLDLSWVMRRRKAAVKQMEIK